MIEGMICILVMSLSEMGVPSRESANRSEHVNCRDSKSRERSFSRAFKNCSEENGNEGK
jgi:hypothetical protein